MLKMIHTMLRVLDLDRSIAFYRNAFGLDVADRYEMEGFTLAYLRNAGNGFELELTTNRGREDPYPHGEGYGHLAFSTDDLEGEHEPLTMAGVAPRDIKSLAYGGRPLARFFFVSDPDGYQIEVLERGGRYA